MLQGFPPVVARDTHTILGSFPGEASLDAAQYYASAQSVLAPARRGARRAENHELAYDARLERVLSHGVGIWDVLVRAIGKAISIRQSAMRSRTTSRRCARMRRC
jgi:hypoxanthine-DNA glycosylase